MVVKTESCYYSGFKIYPGHGIRFVRVDSRSYMFSDSKPMRCYLHKWNPRKLAWTTLYRRAHKKGIQEESQRRIKKRSSRRTLSRGFEGATVEAIKAKRSQKPEVRQAARDAALKEVKERNKATKAKKAADKPRQAKSASAASKVKQPKVNTKAKGSGNRR
eukprot:Rmarinus@m.22902